MCCVEMGLGMIETMRIFDAERHEGIKMRVGIHTGKREIDARKAILIAAPFQETFCAELSARSV